MNRWRAHISRRSRFFRGAAERRVILLVASGALLAGVGLFRPATAHAQTKRFDNFMIEPNNRGIMVYNDILFFADVVPSGSYAFVGSPAAVSDRPGRLWLAAKAVGGDLVYNIAASNGNLTGLLAWRGWSRVPGTRAGGVCAGGRCYTWIDDSSPALSSWGSGRLELFINATRDDGATTLVHTWGDNGTWSGRWEGLGTGLLQGSPAAVSWGPGRTDVFVRGGIGLAHKWFENGSWSRGWEDLGGELTSSRSVTSWGPGHLDIVANGSNGTPAHLWFDSWWSGWESLGKPFWWSVLVPGSSPVVATAGPGSLDFFVEWYNEITRDEFYLKSCANWWCGDFQQFGLGYDAPPIAAIYWVP
jgi:hypothetical protein